MNNKIHVKKPVTPSSFISGKDRGKKGKVLAVSPKEGKVIIEGRNMVSKHVKPRKMGEQGGIVNRLRAQCMPARSRLSARAAANRRVSHIKFMKTAPRNAFVQNAASRCKGRKKHGQNERLL